ncbi:hemagglutinin repeat-containing protein, partial [Gilliamella sp. App4-10]|uniref:hemagglutinin repeat-containing protein n=1 Tax=Gilliamella sp. App4-10 TaxID=3120231 RepID=UPI000A77EF24
NASQSKSREKGNGTDWRESVVEAGNKLTLIIGNDANIVAGQVKGDRVEADIGHNLNIESKQDRDEYHSKNSSTSLGGSVSWGSTNGANAAASQTKMDSTWQSVTDQSGIFAGKGGFDITVGNHTDLKGAVIASAAKDTSKNKLDTGTISFSDIKNQADYKVSSSSAGVNTSGMPSIPTGLNKQASKNSTTHSAVSTGTMVIRHESEQQQAINELSRDTEHASHALKHIFNKDKEQSIIDQTRLVSEIGGETLTMLNHIDRISATSKAKEALNKEQEKAKNNKTVLTDEQQQKIYEDAYKEAMNQGMSAMGSETRQGIDMAVNLINGIISGDMTGAVAGALAPKIASAIKKQTEHYNPETGKWETDHIANTVSHAILGGVVAQLQGNSALVGGLGAAASERSAEVIAGILYPDKDIKDLSQEERQQISALSQLATGLATAAAGGDIQDINTGVAAGKNAVENNGLARGVIKGLEKGYESCMKIPACRSGLMQLGVNFGLTNEQILEAMEVGRTRDINQIKELTPEQIAWLDAQILAKKGLASIMFGNQTFGDRIYNESSGNNDNNNNAVSGSGSVAAGGAPGLPPDDDDDNRHNQDNQKYQNKKQQERFDELRDIYDKNNPTTDLKIDGQTIRQGAGGNRYSTRIYESQNLTDKQIYNYVEELAGQPLTKVKDGVYTTRLPDGTNITLRNVSHSNTGARWTVDIKNNPTLTNLYRGLRTGAEIKFR